jgi:hypothetical protein
MKAKLPLYKNPKIVFLTLFLFINAALWLYPMAMFDGGFVMNDKFETTYPAKMSLSYFIGIGIEPADMVDVKRIFLTGQSIALAICICLMIPFLIAWRVASTSSATQKK